LLQEVSACPPRDDNHGEPLPLSSPGISRGVAEYEQRVSTEIENQLQACHPADGYSICVSRRRRRRSGKSGRND
jgi:hypothetical protein